MKKEVFVPLYVSNICHSSCRICNLRKENKKVIRIQGGKEKLEEQLEILYKRENVREICFLTGELKQGEQRTENFEYIMYAINQAFQHGFQRIFFNIGSLMDEEIDKIYERYPHDNRIVLSLFQETYDKTIYQKVFGSYEQDNPKSNFDRRLTTPERWIKKGFLNVDIGILLGINPDTEQDIEKLIKHANYLYSLGAEVYLSLPRIYQFGKMTRLITDDKYIEYVRWLKRACPWARVIITTRESVTTIKKALPYIDVVSPGCSDIMPYTWEGEIINDERTSQFKVADKRSRPSEIIHELQIKMEVK
ncbi:thiamine biosynthesis protein ThiH [Lachnospiraceae bacterium MD335]|nr:thiamine biosynthesis protein ThiH [Lachnospiraceae bacterium MD335]